MNALEALAKIGGHVRIDEIARAADINARAAHDQLGALIDEGLVAESTWYRLTDQGIEKLRCDGVICTTCRSVVYAGRKQCPRCEQHDKERQAFRDRRRTARKAARKVAVIEGPPPPTPSQVHRASLRDQDQRVLALRSEGLKNGDIAERLGISYTAVKNALARLRLKHDVGDQRFKRSSA